MTMRRLDPVLVADLWFFVHAARLCSFSGAAKLLSVTPGAVSQRIHRLENRLDVRLFVRSGTRLSLTPSGRTLFDSATAAFDAVTDGLSRLSPQRSTQSVVVSCLPSLAIQWLVPRLGEFYSQHPKARVEVRAEFSRVDADLMERDGVDVAIRYDQEPYEPAIEFARIPELVFPVCSVPYAARLRKREKWWLLCDSMPWEGAARLAEWDLWRRGLRTSSFNAPSGQRFYNLAHMAYAAALEHQGVALGRSVLVHRHVSEGTLVPMPGMPNREVAHYRLLVRPDAQAQELVSTFAAWCKEQLERTRNEMHVWLATREGSRRKVRRATSLKPPLRGARSR